MQSLNGDERCKLPDLIKQALKDRGRSASQLMTERVRIIKHEAFPGCGSA